MKFNRNILLLFLIAFFQGCVFYGSIAVSYRIERGIFAQDIFVLEMISTVIMLACEIPWGFFADKNGYVKTLVIANGLFFISKVIFYIADSFFMFLCERICLAIAVSGISGIDSALLYESTPPHEREKVMSLNEGIMQFSFFFSLIMTTILLQWFDSSITALLTAIAYFISFIMTIFLKNAQIEQTKEKQIFHFQQVFHSSKIIYIVLGSSLLFAFQQTSVVFLSQIKFNELMIPMSICSILMLFIYLCGLFSSLSYIIKKKLGLLKMFIIISIILCISSFIIAFSKNIIIVMIVLCIMGSGIYLLTPMTALIKNDHISSTQRATSLSMFAMVDDIIGIAIYFMTSQLVHYQSSYAYLACSFIACLMTICFYRGIKNNG